MSIFIINGQPTTRPEDWKQGLAEPNKHWKAGKSAWALAQSWEEAGGFPSEVNALLTQSFYGIQPQHAMIEHKVLMPAVGRASQNDLFVVAQANDEIICIAVEGKVSETFGATIDKWHSGTPNKEARLSGVLKIIGLPRQIPNTNRYQLLHRMASPVIEARQIFDAKHAVMLIHSFSQTDEHFDDFAAFLALYGIQSPQIGVLYPLCEVNGIQLHAGWARGDKRFLGEQ